MTSLGEVRTIGTVTAILMVLVALIIDAVQLVLIFLYVGIILNPLITIAAYMMFFLWFTLGCGVKFRGKNLAGGVATLILEFIPILNSLPGITSGVVITILTNRVTGLVNKGGLTGAGSKRAVGKLEALAAKRKEGRQKEDGQPRSTDSRRRNPVAMGRTETPRINQEIRAREPLKTFPTKNVGQKPPSRT